MPELCAPLGGEFLIRGIEAEQIFTPEKLTDESRLIARTMEDFVRKEILPAAPKLEAHEPGLAGVAVQEGGTYRTAGGRNPGRIRWIGTVENRAYPAYGKSRALIYPSQLERACIAASPRSRSCFSGRKRKKLTGFPNWRAEKLSRRSRSVKRVPVPMRLRPEQKPSSGPTERIIS